MKNYSLAKISVLAFLLVSFVVFSFLKVNGKLGTEIYVRTEVLATTTEVITAEPPHVLDTALYDAKMLALANNPPVKSASTTAATSTVHASTTPPQKTLWPVKTVYPNYGALLPFNRIVAYYGNYYSKQMGVLGEYEESVMLQKLANEVKRWQQADPGTPVIPAIHYIATTAQVLPQKDNSYMLRMPFSQIDKALEQTKKVGGVTFLDIQVGHGSSLNEAKLLEKYLMLPGVHLGIDPEFSMKGGERPGTRVGTIDGAEINEVAEFLAHIVRTNNLPPKVLVIHRFTQNMVTNYQLIRPLPEVQIVMDMDGWGPKELKRKTYQTIIYSEPVQFTGFKIFYKNDTKKASSTVMTPQEVLQLRPIPSYIQYQ